MRMFSIAKNYGQSATLEPMENLPGYDNWKTMPEEPDRFCARLECIVCREDYPEPPRCDETQDVVKHAERDGWNVDEEYYSQEDVIMGTCPECKGA